MAPRLGSRDPSLARWRAVFWGSHRHHPPAPRVVPAGGDFQHSAHRTNRKDGLVGAHEREDPFGFSRSPVRTRPRLLTGSLALPLAARFLFAAVQVPAALRWSNRRSDFLIELR